MNLNCIRCHRPLSDEVAFHISPAKIESGTHDYTITNTRLDAYLCFDCLTDVF